MLRVDRTPTVEGKSFDEVACSKQAQELLTNLDHWRQADSILALSESSNVIPLPRTERGEGCSEYGLPEGTIALKLIGGVGFDGITLIKLPDGTELVRGPHKYCELEPKNHGEALKDFLEKRYYSSRDHRVPELIADPWHEL